MPLHMGVSKPLLPFWRNAWRPNTVHHYANRYPTLRGTHQSCGYVFAGNVKMENIGFKANLVCARIYGGHEGRKKIISTLQ